MRITHYLLILCLLGSVNQIQAQRKKKVKYAPVENISREDAWPIVAQAIASLNVTPEFFDYGKGVMKTGYYHYRKGIVPNRGKLQFTHKDITLHIEVVDLQLKQADTKKWVPTYPDPLFPKEKQIKGEFAQAVRLIQEDPALSQKAKDQFASNLLFHSFFFATASELAGDIWFNKFLKDKAVNWKLTFTDIQKSKTEGFAYDEYYAAQAGESQLKLIRRTNSDQNVFTNKGNLVGISGTIKALTYENNEWAVVMEE